MFGTWHFGIFHIHFILLTSGLSGTSVLLGVYMQEYANMDEASIGILLASFPFVAMGLKPLFCSMADRRQSHQLYLILSLVTMMVGYLPFVVVPYFEQFYTQHSRMACYLLVIACHVGTGALGVAWSLGDSLAVNMAQKNKTPYGRMRLMGTISWGIYGYVIGQINEISYFPKFVPAFLILQVSVLIEIILLIFWNKEDFVMCDSTTMELEPTKTIITPVGTLKGRKETRDYAMYKSSPSIGCSLAGTLRLTSDAVSALRTMVVAEELSEQLRKVESNLDKDESLSPTKEGTLSRLKEGSTNMNKKASLNNKGSIATVVDQELGAKVEVKKAHDKNPQMFIFKMILTEDGRLIKYLLIYVIFGILLAPINFIFLSLVDVCKEKGYNFSQLSGSILISQATMETVIFLIVPSLMQRISIRSAMSFAWSILAIRYFFYAYFFYTSDISPYWALVAEWGLGVSFGIFCSLLANLSVMFASESELFIPELRKLGYLSDIDPKTDPEKVKEEENYIKVSLKATIQSLFGSALDGLGMGLGALICGAIAESSYVRLWKVLMTVSIATALTHQIIELTRSKYSDSQKPKEGTKAYEIMAMSRSFKVKGEN